MVNSFGRRVGKAAEYTERIFRRYGGADAFQFRPNSRVDSSGDVYLEVTSSTPTTVGGIDYWECVPMEWDVATGAWVNVDSEVEEGYVFALNGTLAMGDIVRGFFIKVEVDNATLEDAYIYCAEKVVASAGPTFYIGEGICSLNKAIAPGVGGIPVAIPWDSASYNVGSIWSGSNPTRFTAPVDGYYLGWSSLIWGPENVDTTLHTYLAKFGAFPDILLAYHTYRTFFETINQTKPFVMNAGDYMEVYVGLSAGGDGTMNINVGSKAGLYLLYEQ